MREKDAADFGICSLIWNAQGRVERKVIAVYLSNKMKKNAVDQIMSYDSQRILRNWRISWIIWEKAKRKK